MDERMTEAYHRGYREGKQNALIEAGLYMPLAKNEELLTWKRWKEEEPVVPFDEDEGEYDDVELFIRYKDVPFLRIFTKDRNGVWQWWPAVGAEPWDLHDDELPEWWCYMPKGPKEAK